MGRDGKNNPTAGMTPQEAAEYERLHPRVAKGRVGGGQFAVSQGTGMKGAPDEQVKEAQRKLNDADGTGKVAVDGRFGPVTATAVRRFQTKQKLEPTGDLDEKTLMALEPQPDQDELDKEAGLRSRGAVIDDEQRLLGTGKYEKEKGAKGGKAKARDRSGRSGSSASGSSSRSGSSRATGDGDEARKNSAADLDPSDPKSIEEFQKAHGLDVDGVIGPETQRMIRRSREAQEKREAEDGRKQEKDREKRRSAASSSATGGRSKEGGENIERGEGMGDKPSPQVKRAQRMLSDLGYDLGEGGEDGMFGPVTEAAVKKLQREVGLEPDGIIGPRTLKALTRRAGRLKAETEMVGKGKAPKDGFKLVEAAGSLDRSPKKNWVENAGGLPRAIEEMAETIHRERGLPISQAIPIAISQAKKLAAKGNAKYVKAVAAWEALKAKAHVEEAPVAAQIEEALKVFEPDLHPRDRNGKFAQILGKLDLGQGARTKSGVTVTNIKDKPGFKVKSGSKVEVHATAEKAAKAALALDDKRKSTERTVRASEDDAMDAIFRKLAPGVARPVKKVNDADAKPKRKLSAVKPKAAEKPKAKAAPKAADPDVIDVGSDVVKAADLLAQGKKVQLSQPREASVLLDELAKRVNAAKDMGDKAPNFDLCNVTVKNTSLFCVQSKGIPRVKMPQLSGKPLPGTRADKMEKNDKGEVVLTDLFRDMLESKGFTVSDETEKASFLKATQNELNGAKVAGMTSALNAGKKLGGDPRLFVSDDNYIVDGHHRWAAHVGNDLQDGKLGEVDMEVARVNMGIIELLAEANNFALDMGIPQAAVNAPIPTAKAAAPDAKEKAWRKGTKPKVPKGTAVQEAILAAHADYLEEQSMIEEAGKPWEKSKGSGGGESVACPSCKMKNPASRDKCWKCKADLPKGKGKKVEEAADGKCTCWKGYERVPGTKPCGKKSCRRKKGAKVEESREAIALLVLEEAERAYGGGLVEAINSLDSGSRLGGITWGITKDSWGKLWVEWTDGKGSWGSKLVETAASAAAMVREMTDVNAETIGMRVEEAVVFSEVEPLLVRLEEAVAARETATGSAQVVARAREDAVAKQLVEAVAMHRAGTFEPLHPRDRVGRFMEKLDVGMKGSVGRMARSMGFGGDTNPVKPMPMAKAPRVTYLSGDTAQYDNGDPGTPRGVINGQMHRVRSPSGFIYYEKDLASAQKRAKGMRAHGRGGHTGILEAVIEEVMCVEAAAGMNFDALHPRDRLGRWMQKLEPGTIVNVSVGAGGVPRTGGTMSGMPRSKTIASMQVERARVTKDDGGKYLGVSFRGQPMQVERDKAYLMNGAKLGTPSGAKRPQMFDTPNRTASNMGGKAVVPMSNGNPTEPRGKFAIQTPSGVRYEDTQAAAQRLAKAMEKSTGRKPKIMRMK